MKIYIAKHCLIIRLHPRNLKDAYDPDNMFRLAKYVDEHRDKKQDSVLLSRIRFARDHFGAMGVEGLDTFYNVYDNQYKPGLKAVKDWVEIAFTNNGRGKPCQPYELWRKNRE
jgi:hypothetical protein